VPMTVVMMMMIFFCYNYPLRIQQSVKESERE